ncbi:MAG: hypothetical protein IPK19_37025 [Chloroflexi bacterium]|nr:hypothetical protein [Chloroflexota bacterium]
MLLETLRDRGGLRTVAAKLVGDLIARAVAERNAAARRREAALDYETIASMAKRKLTVERAREEFAGWRASYPDLVEALDTDHLRERLGQPAPVPPPAQVYRKRPPICSPPFAWVNIPAGKVTLIPERLGEDHIPEEQVANLRCPRLRHRQIPGDQRAVPPVRDCRRLC